MLRSDTAYQNTLRKLVGQGRRAVVLPDFMNPVLFSVDMPVPQHVFVQRGDACITSRPSVGTQTARTGLQPTTAVSSLHTLHVHSATAGGVCPSFISLLCCYMCTPQLQAGLVRHSQHWHPYSSSTLLQ